MVILVCNFPLDLPEDLDDDFFLTILIEVVFAFPAYFLLFLIFSTTLWVPTLNLAVENTTLPFALLFKAIVLWELPV